MMTREEIIAAARKADSNCEILWLDQRIPGYEEEIAFIERFASLVADAEREACAKVCEEQRSIEWVKASMPALIRYEPANLIANKCAAAIRARGQ